MRLKGSEITFRLHFYKIKIIDIVFSIVIDYNVSFFYPFRLFNSNNIDFFLY